MITMSGHKHHNQRQRNRPRGPAWFPKRVLPKAKGQLKTDRLMVEFPCPVWIYGLAVQQMS